ncbi:nose resistant to fluoxetine protein 6-like [Chrysoperla carnea]|uniref:nose resistant to fluoxetine protein 6-like n=1 Tax=Chrysoperla carnea TaxID=189513 RepID=UPI001D073A18|nr:nose resistant to fluoxetine protein 6-like [Chrysoperla carnea]
MFLKICIFIGLFINVWCSNNNNLDLRSDSIVYGLSTINSTVINENTLCTKQLDEFVHAANNRTVWALKIIDASGTPGSGFLWGNNFWEGNHVLCSYITDRIPVTVSPKLPVRHNITDDDYAPYPLHFFGAYILQNSAIQQRYNTSDFEGRITLGLCLPASCERDEVKQRLQIYLDANLLYFQRLHDIEMKVDKIKDLDKGFRSGTWLYSMSFKLTLITFAFLIIMAIIGTTYDVKLNKAKDLAKQNLEDAIANESKINEKIPSAVGQTFPPVLQGSKASLSMGSKILLAFSLNSNIKSLFKTKSDPTGASLPFIHGFRFGSMCWVITVHAILYQRDFMANTVVVYKLSELFYNGPYSNGELCVDSFFFLSGFLVGYIFFKSNMKKFGDVSYTFSQKLLHYMVSILSRYLRFTPTILILIIWAIVNFQYYQDSFLVEIDERVPDNCSKYWWRNILYINNFFAYKDMCLSWSWFLSADMQFLVLTTAILFFSLTHFTAAFIIMIVLAISSCLTAMYISYSIKFIPTLDENLVTIDYLYEPPWTRYGPYVIGTLTGYYVVRLNGVLDWKKSTIKLCWVLGPLLNLSILYCLQPDRNLSVPVAALYTGLHRPLWGIGLAWLFIACSTNNAGIINRVLSYRGFVPMSRLTTCAYLLNPFLLLSYSLGMEEGFFVGQFNIGRTGFMLIFVTYLTSFLISIFIEMPSYRISKLILFEQSHKPNSSSNKDLTK